MTIEKLKAEFGPKDVLTYCMVAITVLFGGFKLDSLARSNAEGVAALHLIVENQDSRIGDLEAYRLTEESFRAGYEEAMSERGQ